MQSAPVRYRSPATRCTRPIPCSPDYRAMRASTRTMRLACCANASSQPRPSTLPPPAPRPASSPPTRSREAPPTTDSSHSRPCPRGFRSQVEIGALRAHTGGWAYRWRCSAEALSVGVLGGGGDEVVDYRLGGAGALEPAGLPAPALRVDEPRLDGHAVVLGEPPVLAEALRSPGAGAPPQRGHAERRAPPLPRPPAGRRHQ